MTYFFLKLLILAFKILLKKCKKIQLILKIIIIILNLIFNLKINIILNQNINRY